MFDYTLEFTTVFDYTLEYRKGSATGNADFLSRLPEIATEHDRSGSSSLTPWMMAVSASSGPAGFALVPHRPPVLAWVGWCPAS